MDKWEELEIRILANLEEARKKTKTQNGRPLTMEEVYDHLRNNPDGCKFGSGCDVCQAAKGYKT